ncbi:MAG: putative Ig domain-containing protein [Acidobacteria bacterium]|nr:putative Ig domain-containing protein [Acidobacteriota bacterium]
MIKRNDFTPRKNKLRQAIWLVCALAMAFGALRFGAFRRVAAHEQSTLHDAEAIARLNQQGAYDSLAAAIQAARSSQASLATVTTSASNALSSQTQTAKVMGGGVPHLDSQFGYSVALSGDTAVVGAPFDTVDTSTEIGVVYVFVRNSFGYWYQQAALTANDAADQDEFGLAVSISGDTIAVGAPMDDVGTHTNQGSVYIFTRTGTTWAQQWRINAIGGTSYDQFGNSVSLDGNTVLVGTGQIQTAYAFVRTGGLWTQLPQTLVAPIPQYGDGFGSAVAFRNNIALVGAPNRTVNGNTKRGTAYVFARSGFTWTVQQIIAPDGTADANFGSSVALNENATMLIVGAESANVSPGTKQGAAYVFELINGSWVFRQRLTADDGATDDWFGYTVAIEGNAILVGAPRKNNWVGTAYRFVRGSIFWTQDQKLAASDVNGNRYFGFAVALNNGRSLIGATDVPDPIYSIHVGAAYIFEDAPPLTITPGSLPNGYVGTHYDKMLTASGGFAPYTFSFGSGTLPPGMSLGSSGWVSGVPSGTGSFNFSVLVTDDRGYVGTQSYTLTIQNCPAVTIAPASLPAGTQGAAYNQTLTASGGVAPYSFHIMSGTFPAGMTYAANGTMSGTPTASGVFNFTVKATDANGCFGTRSYTLTINQGGGASANNLQFYPLAHPVRLLDTRVGFTGCDSPGAKITGGTSRTQTAAGRTCDGLTIPANAAALVGNATSVQSGGGYFTLYPSDIAKPNSANSNYAANQILNSLFTVRLGANDGAFKIFVSTDTDIVVDITGYYAPSSATGLYFHPLPKPVRLLDTRPGASACFAPGAALQGNTDASQVGTTTCDSVLIPAGAMALTGNATTVSPQANGFLTLYPSDAARPLIASANFQPGVNLNSPFMVGLSPSGQFNIYVASTTDLVIDVTGYYSTQMSDSNGQGLLFNALSGPSRLLNTQAGQTACYTPNAPMTGGTSYTQAATGACSNVPATAQAVVGNATTMNAVANGYLTFWPSDASQPLIATSNYRTGITCNRHFTVGLGTDGAFKRYAASTTDLVVDLVGFFAP